MVADYMLKGSSCLERGTGRAVSVADSAEQLQDALIFPFSNSMSESPKLNPPFPPVSLAYMRISLPERCQGKKVALCSLCVLPEAKQRWRQVHRTHSSSKELSEAIPGGVRGRILPQDPRRGTSGLKDLRAPSGDPAAQYVT